MAPLHLMGHPHLRSSAHKREHQHPYPRSHPHACSCTCASARPQYLCGLVRAIACLATKWQRVSSSHPLASGVVPRLTGVRCSCRRGCRQNALCEEFFPIPLPLPGFFALGINDFVSCVPRSSCNGVPVPSGALRNLDVYFGGNVSVVRAAMCVCCVCVCVCVCVCAAVLFSSSDDRAAVTAGVCRVCVVVTLVSVLALAQMMLSSATNSSSQALRDVFYTHLNLSRLQCTTGTQSPLTAGRCRVSSEALSLC